MPWTVIRNPARPHLAFLRRLRPWRFSIRQPSRYLPRSPFVLADIVALHPLKGVAGVVLTAVALPLLPSLAPLLQGVIWVWFGAFALGFLRSLRLMRIRSPRWLRLMAARKPNGAVK
jgi:hypothetical protein